VDDFRIYMQNFARNRLAGPGLYGHVITDSRLAGQARNIDDSAGKPLYPACVAHGIHTLKRLFQ